MLDDYWQERGGRGGHRKWTPGIETSLPATTGWIPQVLRGKEA